MKTGRKWHKLYELFMFIYSSKYELFLFIYSAKYEYDISNT